MTPYNYKRKASTGPFLEDLAYLETYITKCEEVAGLYLKLGDALGVPKITTYAMRIAQRASELSREVLPQVREMESLASRIESGVIPQQSLEVEQLKKLASQVEKSYLRMVRQDGSHIVWDLEAYINTTTPVYKHLEEEGPGYLSEELAGEERVQEFLSEVFE